MKRTALMLIVILCMMFCGAAAGESIDISNLSFYDLCILEERVKEAKEKIMFDLVDQYAAERESSEPVVLDVSIDSIKIGENSIGTPEVYVVLKNCSADLTIDRVDFLVKCYDAYGDLIKPYGRYTYTSCFYDDKIKPGYKSPSHWRWTLYDCDGTDSVNIAIEKYHATDGTTVSVPDDQLAWVEFEK